MHYNLMAMKFILHKINKDICYKAKQGELQWQQPHFH